MANKNIVISDIALRRGTNIPQDLTTGEPFIYKDSSSTEIMYRLIIGIGNNQYKQIFATSSLAELTDVDLTSLNNNEVLAYDSASSTWKPKLITFSAEDISYDNTASQAQASSVQEALDELFTNKLNVSDAQNTYATKTSVSTISGKIPEAASTDNLLVDTNAMNAALAGKANKAEVYTKGEVDAKVSSVYKYKGSVANEAALPEDSNTTGDVYNVEDTGMNYAWDGTQWDKLGGDVDLTSYLTKESAETTYAKKSEIANKADKATTLAGYGIEDAYTKSHVDTELGKKLDSITASSTYATITTVSGIEEVIPEEASSDNQLVTSDTLSEYSTKSAADTLYAAKSVESTVSSLSTKVDGKADKATTLSGYGITDAYTKDEINTELDKKLDETVAVETYATIVNLNSHTSNTENPHSVTKAQIGLGNVDNTSDANKPISTATQTALNLKANSADVYTKSQVDTELAKKLDSTTASSTYATKTELSQQVASVYKVKGSVATESALPQEGNTIGDVYNVETDGSNYVWDGTQWDKLGGTVDLSNYYTKSQVDTELGKKLDTTTASSTYLSQTTASSTYATIQALNAKADASDVTSIEDTIATYGTMATKNADDYSTKAVADTLYAPASLSGTVSTLSTTVSGKANASEVYTKTVADSTFATKTELSNKANNATTLEGYGITDAYTSEEVDQKISDALGSIETALAEV